MKRLRIYSLLTLFSVLLAVLTINRINSKLGLPGTGLDASMFMVLYLISICFFLYPSKSRPTKSMTGIVLVLFITMLPATLFLTSGSELINSIIVLLAMPIGIMVGKKLLHLYHSNGTSDLFLTILLLPAIIGVLWTIYLSNNMILIEESRDYIFSLVVFLPLIYYYKRPFLKFILIILLAYLALTSTKRTAIIMVAVSLCLYVFYNFRSIKKNLFNGVIVLILVVAVAGFASKFISNDSFNDAFEITKERMTNFDDESNNERKDMYQELLFESDSFNFIELCYGHGYNAVSRNLFGHPAHNDYLELFYDYGIVAALCYLFLIIKCLFYGISRTFQRRKGHYSPFFIVNTILIFIVLSMANCIVINPTYIFVAMITIGWSLEATRLDFEKYDR